MRNKFLCLIIILGCGLLANAQNPGFQGKRLSLYYNLYTLNSMRFPNEFGNAGILSFNTTHTVNMDVAIGRRACIGGAFEYLHTSFPYADHLEYNTDDPNDYGYSGREFYSKDVGQLETFGVGLYIKRFLRGSIAPLGTYIKPQVTLLFTKVYPGNPLASNGTSLKDLNLHLTNMSPYFNYAISLEVGQTRIFFNRMFLDYGIRFGMMPAAEEFVTGMPQLRADNYLEVVPLMRLSSHYLLNVNVGVGVLLF